MYCNIIFSDFKVFLVLPAANMCVWWGGGVKWYWPLYTEGGYVLYCGNVCSI